MTTTEKDPKKESAMKAPTMGMRLLVPKMMLVICVALMLFTLNFVIRNTIKLDPHPPPAIDRPNILPDSVHHFIIKFINPFKTHNNEKCSFVRLSNEIKKN